MAYNWLELPESGPHNLSLSPSVVRLRELQAAPAKAAMAEALSIDMDEMKAISPETELEHSHATGMIIDLNDVVSNIVMDAERAWMSRVA